MNKPYDEDVDYIKICELNNNLIEVGCYGYKGGVCFDVDDIVRMANLLGISCFKKESELLVNSIPTNERG